MAAKQFGLARRDLGRGPGRVLAETADVEGPVVGLAGVDRRVAPLAG